MKYSHLMWHKINRHMKVEFHNYETNFEFIDILNPYGNLLTSF